MSASWLFLRNLMSARSRRPSRPLPRRDLLLELLEARCVPAIFNVNTLSDPSIAAGVNAAGMIGTTGVVSLRSAIQAANANSGAGGNFINLPLPGTYLIQLAPTTPNETDNAAGEFSIYPVAPNGNLTIMNTSGGVAAVNANGLSRVFDINASNTNDPATHFTVTMQGFTIENGRAFDATGATPDGAVASGGGIRDQGNESLTLTNMVLTNNNATADGGGVSMENSISTPWTLTLTNTMVSNNQAGDAGGGVETDGSGKVFITNSTITGNNTVNQGAGIWLDAIPVLAVFQGANLTLTDSTVSANVATNGPTGGIGNAGNGTVTIIRSTVANNFCGPTPGLTAAGGGGFGDSDNEGSLVVTNSTFVGNSTAGSGGGILEAGASTTINDSTITGNMAFLEGGGLSIATATFTLNNTIVAQNQANGGTMNFMGTDPDVVGAVSSGQGNFIGIGATGLSGIMDGSNGNQIGTAANPKNPLLGPLQNNGGPTMTELPRLGSPVIATGVVGVIPAGTTTDQRGFPRTINNTVDIGAVETPPTGFVVAEFPGFGVFRYSTATGVWTNLTPVNASLLANDANGDVAAEFMGYGVFRYLNSTGVWTPLTPVNASLLGMDSAGDVFAEFPGYGVQRFTTSWQVLTPANASVLAVDGNGDVAADLAGSGVFLYTAATAMWVQITPANASILVIDNNRDVVGEFPGFGVQRYTTASATFTQLTPANASALAIDANGNVFAEFMGFGVYRYSSLTNMFTQLTTANASLLAADAGGDLFADFPGFGVQQWSMFFGFKQLTPVDASILVAS